MSDDERKTRSQTDANTQFVKLGDKNTVTSQSSEVDYISGIDTEIKKQYKLTQYQSTDEQLEIYKKISEKYRTYLIDEQTKYSISDDRKNKRIYELEQQNKQLLQESPTTQSDETFTDNFLPTLDKSLTQHLNITEIKSRLEQISIYEQIINVLQQQYESISKKFEKSQSEISNQAETIQQLNQSISVLKTTVNNFSTQQEHTVPTFPFPQNTLQNLQNKMNIESKDLITAIPVYSGDQKELDTFINTCDLYNSLITNNEQKATLLLIIKAKIRGEALSKVIPYDDCNNWQELKKRILDRIRKPVTLEFAQEDLNKVSQGPNESIEDYGKKVRNKLRKLNEASRQMGTTDAERAILQKANERLAISKFEQNIRDNTIRVLVSATKNDTLDDAIQIALQKELMEKNKNSYSMKCTNCGMNNCGMNNHTFETCRRRQQSNENKNKPLNKSFNRNFVKNENKNEAKPATVSADGQNRNQTQNQNQNQGQHQNPNRNFNRNSNQKNVRFVDEEMDSMTLQEALDREESDVPKNE